MEQLVVEVERTLADKFWKDFQMDFKDENWDGKHFFLHVVSEQFVGMSPVARSQLVYEILDPYMKTGAIHALRMNLKTPQEL